MPRQRDNRAELAKADRPVRCAIYTRKSSEEGLDQNFNSLDAQREACAAYVMSQRHEGWVLVPDYYDDGGISGGHMNRPGLLKLLDDVNANKVDVIVVYKVDRLTRALSDFARIVDILDEAGASFVSITQSFNTTTSMGRLTLNVLLSFAQFEREVTGERIRDKIAASKKKGMWMGGTIALGYDVKDRKLVVNHREADVVRMIMTRYVALTSVPALVDELAAAGIVSKRRIDRNGRATGGTPYRRGALYDLLANRLYRGDIIHKGVAHPGEHEAIVDQPLWDEVQQLLASNRVTRRHQGNASDPSLLAGMIHDIHGRRMSPCHAGKANRRYRYYVSVKNEGTSISTPAVVRVAAGEVEAAIIENIPVFLRDATALVTTLGIDNSATQIDGMRHNAAALSDDMSSMPPSELHALFAALDLQVIIDGQNVAATVGWQLLAVRLGVATTLSSGGRCNVPTPNLLTRTGHEVRLAIAPQHEGAPIVRDGGLVTLIVKAHEARDMLIGQGAGVTDAGPASSHRHLVRLARLAYLAPDIIVAIMEGRQPKSMTSRALLRVSNMPLDWSEQRKMFGI